jgi:hypothetical protein
MPIQVNEVGNSPLGLTRREADAMIDGIVGNKQLPANIRQDIIERTDGIPLFVEEMAMAVLEAESQSRPSVQPQYS